MQVIWTMSKKLLSFTTLLFLVFCFRNIYNYVSFETSISIVPVLHFIILSVVGARKSSIRTRPTTPFSPSQHCTYLESFTHFWDLLLSKKWRKVSTFLTSKVPRILGKCQSKQPPHKPQQPTSLHLILKWRWQTKSQTEAVERDSSWLRQTAHFTVSDFHSYG